MKMKYSGHLPPTKRNFSAPNFGLGARQIDKALINASLENLGGVKNNTHKARSAACRDFALFLKQETDVKRLNAITKQEVTGYAEYLRERYECNGQFSARAARDYLSHINVCLRQARGDSKLTVLATKEMDFPPKNEIETIDRSVSEELHNQIVTQASEPVAVISQLQRAFGLRFREASLTDCEKALKEYHSTGFITVSRGTKGGQDRTIEIENSNQVSALERGANLQAQTGHVNATPVDSSFKAFQSKAWREVKSINSNYLSHGERKFFACQYYTEKMGVVPPVIAGVSHGKAHLVFAAERLGITVSEARIKDEKVRLQLSQILGHHRPGITNAYIG
ncbi:hypothetical protein VIN01S_00710 [Vibrio inusitatus NBRC 102082]|uniref:Integrase catalytic domain-containing protein n=1 Tax=Vibrio inusitatus NBRC 102082 TaxID=1219070 RepID=A0A4Y3HQG0_9VIBR|nr:integrase domain-containing protein [Vibrio inusitatus]GEA49267.1 hypothetical protein VIN01S_00710 [Vibrio inusitatus NBRC 102082]